MRILQVHTRYRQRGGEDVVVEAEAELLRQAGHEVRQVVAHNSHRPVGAAVQLLAAPWNARWTRKLRRVVREFRPDVVHVHNTWYAMSPAVIRAAKREGVPVVMTLHNYRLTCANALLFRDGRICEECVGASPWRAVRYRCYRGSRLQSAVAAATIALHRRLGTWTDHVDRFVALTDFQRDLMVRAGLPPDKVVVKPNFVPDPGARPSPPSASNIVLYVGRLSFEKGVDLLLEAWRQADTGDLELWVVGDGPMREELARNPPAGVRMKGLVPGGEVRSLMLRSRALVVPSRGYEALPTVILEAAAAGLGVLLPAPSSPASAIEHAVGRSWLFTSGQLPVLTDCLERLAHGLRCDDAGHAMRKLYENAFTPQHAAHALGGFYAAVSGRRDLVGGASR